MQVKNVILSYFYMRSSAQKLMLKEEHFPKDVGGFKLYTNVFGNTVQFLTVRVKYCPQVL